MEEKQRSDRKERQANEMKEKGKRVCIKKSEERKQGKREKMIEGR